MVTPEIFQGTSFICHFVGSNAGEVLGATCVVGAAEGFKSAYSPVPMPPVPRTVPAAIATFANVDSGAVGVAGEGAGAVGVAVGVGAG
jgi:hypothetical protein